ncbi:MAG: Spy/CpxP family protein refolding chaperone [Bacteroidales bacterium]
MKAQKYLMLIFALFFSLQISAQRNNKGVQQKNCFNLPELTQEQENKISELRSERLQESTAHRAKMDELRAQKRSLSIAENADMNKINGIIDQMASLRADHLKSLEQHRQSVREILTPEQRAVFDSRPHMRNRSKGKGYNRSGQGRGRGPNQGNFGYGR